MLDETEQQALVFFPTDVLKSPARDSRPTVHYAPVNPAVKSLSRHSARPSRQTLRLAMIH